MSDTLTEQRVLSTLREQVEALRRNDSRLPVCEVTPSCSFTADLGFDSVSIIELVCAVEQALTLDALPINDWLYQEGEKSGGRYSVAAFVQLALEHGRTTSHETTSW